MGHQGRSRYHPIDVYVYAADVLKTLDKYWHIPGVKKTYSLMPDIFPLSDDEADEVEKLIENEGFMTTHDARQRGWYYDTSTMPEEFLRKYWSRKGQNAPRSAVK